MPHTSKGDAQGGPMARREGTASMGDAKERKKGFSLLTPLCLFLFSLNLICFAIQFLCIHKQRPSLFIDESHDPISIGLLNQTCFESVQYSSKNDSYMRQNWNHTRYPQCTHSHTHMGCPQPAPFQVLIDPRERRISMQVEFLISHLKWVQFESNSKLVRNNFERLSIPNSLDFCTKSNLNFESNLRLINSNLI